MDSSTTTINAETGMSKIAGQRTATDSYSYNNKNNNNLLAEIPSIVDEVNKDYDNIYN